MSFYLKLRREVSYLGLNNLFVSRLRVISGSPAKITNPFTTL